MYYEMMGRNTTISSIWNRHVIIFIILTWMRSVALGSSDVVRLESQSSIDNEMIFSRLRLPWIDGIIWLTASNGSAHLEEVRSLIRGIEANEEWALQMLNEFSQSQREIRLKSIREIDVRDQCSGDNAQSNGETRSAQFLDHAVKSGLVANELGVQIRAESCGRVAYGDFTIAESFTLFCISSVCAFIFACTICDFMKRCTSSKVSTTVNTLAKFSLYTNVLELLDTNASSGTMQALHGLRFLNCFMVVTLHHYASTLLLLRHRMTTLDLLDWKNTWAGLYLTMTPFAVDTFFVISGFCTTYVLFTAEKAGMKFNLLSMYLRRYFRLTPCLGVLMLLFMTFFHRAMTFFHRAGSGPLLESSMSPVVDLCLKNWWTNFLYIQNFVNKESMCLAQFWYMAVDMQLFWISPIILYPLHRWPRIGVLLLGIFLVGSVPMSAFVLAANGYSNALLRLDYEFPKLLESIFNFHQSIVNHAFPYLFGILLGYEVASKKRDLTKVNVAINWVAAGSSLSFCVWANYKVHNSNFAYDSWIETTFAFLLRPSWSIAMAWIIYACTQGYGGIATKFLSLPIFVPLSRLSFSIYLVHMFVQGYYIAASKIPTTFSGSELSHGIFGELMTSIAAAAVLNLFIETPVLVLVNMLTHRGRQQKQK